MGHDAWGIGYGEQRPSANTRLETRARDLKAKTFNRLRDKRSEKRKAFHKSFGAGSTFSVPSCPVVQFPHSNVPRLPSPVPVPVPLCELLFIFPFLFYFSSFRFISCCCVSEKHFSQASKKKKFLFT